MPSSGLIKYLFIAKVLFVPILKLYHYMFVSRVLKAAMLHAW